MSGPIARIGATFRLSAAWSWVLALLGLVGVTGFAALATRFGALPIAIALVGFAVVTVLSLRWPLVALAAFAALIPFEEVTLIDGFGTLSRFAGLLFAVTYGLPRIGRLAIGAMPPAGWAWFAWAVVSLGWAIDPEVTSGQLTTVFQLFLIALLVADFVVERPEIVRPVLWVYGVSAAIVALIGIQSYLGVQASLAADARAAALEAQNPAQFAAVLLPAVAFGVYEVLNGVRRIPAAVIAFLTTLGILVSGTRGAWLAVAVVVLLVILPQLPRRRRIAAIAATAAAAFAILQVPGVTELVTGRLESALSSGGAGRTDIWSVAATIYQSAPVLGVGYANFPIAYTPEVVRAADVTQYTVAGSGPHNVVIGTLVELGPIGLLLLVLFLAPLVLRRGWGPEAAAIQAALVSLMTLALFLDIVGNRKQVWLFIGFAAGLAYLARRARSGLAAETGATDAAAGEAEAPGIMPVAGSGPPPGADPGFPGLGGKPVPARHR